MNDAGIFAGWDDAIRAGELRFPHCRACGTWNWYPLPRCRGCGSAAQEWTQVPPQGTLHSWTRVHRVFAREAVADVPYVTGLVEVVAGVRLVCLHRSGSPVEPWIGMPVRLSLDRAGGSARWLFDARDG